MPSLKTSEQIIIALDTQNQKELMDLIEKLEAKGHYVKVGMELFYGIGPSIIQTLKEKGFKIFLDLKVHDIPNTTRAAIKALTKLGVDMLNVHASGGKEMMKAARLGMEEALLENPKLTRPLLIAVTQLTSSNQKMLQDELGLGMPLEQSVMNYAKMAQEAGLDGVVCSPLEVKAVKMQIKMQIKMQNELQGDKNFICVTPGIRTKDTSSHDQKRITTPVEALKNGADYLVIGRAITQEQNPKVTLDQIIKEIENE